MTELTILDKQAFDNRGKTDPNYTKAANIRGNRVTSIDPAYQQSMAEKAWGLYGATWGLRDIELSEHEAPGNPNKYMLLQGNFFHPTGSFPIIHGILTGSYTQGKYDPEWPKKLQTGAVSKALAYCGFNRDVFLGKYDDDNYVAQMAEDFAPEPELISEKDLKDVIKMLDPAGVTPAQLCKAFNIPSLSQLQAKRVDAVKSRLAEKAKAQ